MELLDRWRPMIHLTLDRMCPLSQPVVRLYNDCPFPCHMPSNQQCRATRWATGCTNMSRMLCTKTCCSNAGPFGFLHSPCHSVWSPTTFESLSWQPSPPNLDQRFKHGSIASTLPENHKNKERREESLLASEIFGSRKSLSQDDSCKKKPHHRDRKQTIETKIKCTCN